MFGFGLKRKCKPRITAVSESAVGLVRENNEDHLLVDGQHLVYCVADGMGGGADGEKASEIVCAEIEMLVRYQPADFASRMEASCAAVVCSNEAIFDYSQAMGFEQMGTTLSLLVFDPEDSSHAALCHVGDSRIYRFRKGKVSQLTRDHSVGAELGRRLGGADLANRANPLAHVLTRAIGTGKTVCPDWKKITVEPGDRYLLCTDGVHDVVSDERLLELVANVPLEEAKRALKTEVYDCGAPDNLSFVILDVEAE